MEQEFLGNFRNCTLMFVVGCVDKRLFSNGVDREDLGRQRLATPDQTGRLWSATNHLFLKSHTIPLSPRFRVAPHPQEGDGNLSMCEISGQPGIIGRSEGRLHYYYLGCSGSAGSGWAVAEPRINVVTCFMFNRKPHYCDPICQHRD
jgi:hypothetical protein